MQSRAIEEALSQSITKEHSLHKDFSALFFQHGLSPLQVARAMCGAYPMFPDALALGAMVAEEAQEQGPALQGTSMA